MKNRIFQFLTICYRYNSHKNKLDKIFIPIVGTENAIIIHKQYIHQYKYKIKGFNTGLNSSKIAEIVRNFFNAIPYYPEVSFVEFKNFSEYLSEYKYYSDIDQFI